MDNAPLGPFQEEFALASLTNNYRSGAGVIKGFFCTATRSQGFLTTT